MAKVRVRTQRPKGTVDQIRQRGGDALALLLDTRAVLERRLEPNTAEQLRADLAAIGAVVPGALTARGQKRAATGAERTTAVSVADHIRSIRDNIKHAYPTDKAVLKGWGVGGKVSANTTKSVVAAGNTIVERAAAKPEEVGGAGLVADDIARLAAEIATLQGADDAQVDVTRASKEATSSRDGTLIRVENAACAFRAIVITRIAAS